MANHKRVTAGDIRRALEGVPDETPVAIMQYVAGSDDDDDLLVHLEFRGASEYQGLFLLHIETTVIADGMDNWDYEETFGSLAIEED